MRNPVGISMKKDEIVIRISEGATHKEIIECLNKKLPALKKLYKTEKTPIFVTEDGTKYHSSLMCSGLIRNIITVEKSKVKDRAPCSRCATKG